MFAYPRSSVQINLITTLTLSQGFGLFIRPPLSILLTLIICWIVCSMPLCWWVFCFRCHSKRLCLWHARTFSGWVTRPHAEKDKQRIAHMTSMGEKLTHSQRNVRFRAYSTTKVKLLLIFKFSDTDDVGLRACCWTFNSVARERKARAAWQTNRSGKIKLARK